MNKSLVLQLCSLVCFALCCLIMQRLIRHLSRTPYLYIKGGEMMLFDLLLCGIVFFSFCFTKFMGW